MKKIIAALLLFSASAWVQASLVNGSVSVGQAGLGSKTSNTSFGVSAGTGLGLLPLVGLEAGVLDLGKFDNIEYGGTTYETLEGNLAYIAAKPAIPLGPITAYAKGGLHQYELTGSGGFKEDEIGVMYGAGIDYFAMGPFSVGASYTVYSLEQDDIENFAINAAFHFL